MAATITATNFHIPALDAVHDDLKIVLSVVGSGLSYELEKFDAVANANNAKRLAFNPQTFNDGVTKLTNHIDEIIRLMSLSSPDSFADRPLGDDLFFTAYKVTEASFKELRSLLSNKLVLEPDGFISYANFKDVIRGLANLTSKASNSLQNLDLLPLLGEFIQDSFEFLDQILDSNFSKYFLIDDENARSAALSADKLEERPVEEMWRLHCAFGRIEKMASLLSNYSIFRRVSTNMSDTAATLRSDYSSVRGLNINAVNVSVNTDPKKVFNILKQLVDNGIEIRDYYGLQGTVDIDLSLNAARELEIKASCPVPKGADYRSLFASSLNPSGFDNHRCHNERIRHIDSMNLHETAICSYLATLLFGDTHDAHYTRYGTSRLPMSREVENNRLVIKVTIPN